MLSKETTSLAEMTEKFREHLHGKDFMPAWGQFFVDDICAGIKSFTRKIQLGSDRFSFLIIDGIKIQAHFTSEDGSIDFTMTIDEFGSRAEGTPSDLIKEIFSLTCSEACND